MPRRLYPVVIHNEGNDCFGATFVDFPVNGGGSSVEDALSDAEAILDEMMPEFLAETGGLPAPTPIHQIPPDYLEGGPTIALIPVQVPALSKRISVTLDEDLIERIDAVASNRSGFLADAARQRLGMG